MWVWVCLLLNFDFFFQKIFIFSSFKKETLSFDFFEF